MWTLQTKCPFCGQPLTVYVSTEYGREDQQGTECPCGADPVFRIDWIPEIGGCLRDDRTGAEPPGSSLLDAILSGP